MGMAHAVTQALPSGDLVFCLQVCCCHSEMLHNSIFGLVFNK
jgi:hypothetical protein